MREFLRQRPLLGWALAAALGIVAVWVLVLGMMRGGETGELTQMITIRCAETGETWQLPRGAVEKELMMRPFPVKPEEGLPNPKTGKLTGFPIDQWTETVGRVNATRESAMTERQQDDLNRRRQPPPPAR